MWFKVDDQLAFHHKTVQAGNSAMGLWVRAGAWSCAHLTDGYIPRSMALAMANECDSDALVMAGLWDEADGGYRFHDWFAFQPSTEAERAKRKARSEAGKLGAAARWDGKPNGKPHGKPMASAMANTKQTDAPSPSPSPMSPPTEETPRADVRDLCLALSEALTHNGVKHTVGKGWHTAARLILDNDGRPFDEVIEVIDFATTDDFWKPNILSMPKLRAKYDTLRLQMRRAPAMSNQGSFYARELARIEAKERAGGNVVQLQLGTGS